MPVVGVPGVFEALLLIAIGIGYIVIYFAKREEKELQFIGYAVGTLIIVLSFIFLIGNLWLQSKGCSGLGYKKAMMKQRLMQPGIPKAPAQ